MAKSAKGKGGGKAKAKGRRQGPPKPSRDIGPKDNLKNGIDPDGEKSLFLNNARAWDDWKAKRKVVDELEREVKANLKGDGFTVKQFQIRDELLTLKGEKKVTGEVHDRLRVARWIGHPMGAQLDLFAQAGGGAAKGPKTLDEYYAEGKQASMEGKSPKPTAAPGSPEYDSFMSGYNDHQNELGKQFKRTEGEGEAEASDVNVQTFGAVPGGGNEPEGGRRRANPFRDVVEQGDAMIRGGGES